MHAARLTTRRFAAFTLIEMLVVIGIIIVLVGLVIAAVGGFSKTANNTAARQQLTAISMALSQYNDDFKDYPPSNYANVPSSSAYTFGVLNSTINSGGWDGAELMTQAIVAPRGDDGHTGNGFTVDANIGSKVYGPYLDVKNSTIFATNTSGAPNTTYALTLPTSAVKAPILYYHRNNSGAVGAMYDYDNTGSNPTTEQNRIWGSGGVFRTDDNIDMVRRVNGSGANSYDVVDKYWAVGPVDPDPTDSTPPGPSEADGKAMQLGLRVARFLLVNAGADDKFGTPDDIVVPGP